jgi:type II secretory pathway component PulF
MSNESNTPVSKCAGCNCVGPVFPTPLELPIGWTVASAAAEGETNYSTHRVLCPVCSTIEELRLLGIMLDYDVCIRDGAAILAQQTGKPVWSDISRSVGEGARFAEALASNPFPSFPAEQQKLLGNMMLAGELGGLLNVVLSRFVRNYYLTTNDKMDEITELLQLLSLLIQSGVPILRAVSVLPTRSENLEAFKKKLHFAIHEGNSTYEPFLALLGKEQADQILAGEDIGAFPEALMALANRRMNWNEAPE